MADSFTVEESNRLVWAPDFFAGATCFFVGAYLLLPPADGDRAAPDGS